jgi:hypothetical protein
MPVLTTPSETAEEAGQDLLAITIRRPDGVVVQRERSALHHRQVHLALLHGNTLGYVEIAAGRRVKNGKLRIYTRRQPDHFHPVDDDFGWRAPLLALAAAHDAQGDEVFLGMAPRIAHAAGKEQVHWTRCLWVDIDEPGHQDRVDALLSRFPAHLEIDSGGGGVDPADRHRHLVWLLDRPMAARTVTDHAKRRYINPAEVMQPTAEGRLQLVGYRDRKTGRVITNAQTVEWIERANRRLIHQLGHTIKDGKRVSVADTLCQERARVLRLAGTRNGKTGRHARIVRMDLALAPYSPAALVGPLPDPPRTQPVRKRDLRSRKYDPYRLIPTSVYFPLLAKIEAPSKGKVHCPSPTHTDEEPSCSVSEYVWFCHGCQAAGTIYDLASLVKGGPTREALVASKQWFRAASEHVREQCTHVL